LLRTPLKSTIPTRCPDSSLGSTSSSEPEEFQLWLSDIFSLLFVNIYNVYIYLLQLIPLPSFRETLQFPPVQWWQLSRPPPCSSDVSRSCCCCFFFFCFFFCFFFSGRWASRERVFQFVWCAGALAALTSPNPLPGRKQAPPPSSAPPLPVYAALEIDRKAQGNRAPESRKNRPGGQQRDSPD